MKVLLDACVWRGALEQIRAAGHDVLWVGEWDKDPGDEAIFEVCKYRISHRRDY